MTSEDVLEEHVQTKKMVYDLLQDDERCRNSDLWLILQIWMQKQHIDLKIPYSELSRMVTPESITRARREIQNSQCKFLPTDPSVLVHRQFKREVLEAYFGAGNRILEEWSRIEYQIR